VYLTNEDYQNKCRKNVIMLHLDQQWQCE